MPGELDSPGLIDTPASTQQLHTSSSSQLSALPSPEKTQLQHSRHARLFFVLMQDHGWTDPQSTEYFRIFAALLSLFFAFSLFVVQKKNLNYWRSAL